MFTASLVAIALICAGSVVAFVVPVRSAIGLLGCIVAVAGMTYAAGAPEVAGLLLWVLGAGAGLVLLTTILLLNLTPEEVGSRRFSLRRTTSFVVTAWTAAAVFAIVLEEAPPRPARRQPAQWRGRAGGARWPRHRHGARLPRARVCPRWRAARRTQARLRR